MVKLTLSTGDTREHDRIEIREDYVFGHEITDEDDYWGDVTKIYPLYSVVEIDPDDDEIDGRPPADARGLMVGPSE